MIRLEKQDKFMELLKPLTVRLERYALAITMNREEAKDVVGETVMLAWENFDKLKSKDAFLSFLFTIASRVYNKRQRSFFKFRVQEAQDIDELYCKSLPPDVSTDVGILYKALEKLPAKQKEAVILYEIMGFSIKEICGIQDSKTSSVKMRLARGRQKIAELMGVRDYGLRNDNTSKIDQLSYEKGQ
ncbi:RNA polymerase sigma factor [Bacteroidota bacterium]